MNTFLRDLALAHQKHEGWYKGSMSYRNNNPGNLRLKSGAFAVYPSYAAGLAALEYDLKCKITNNSPSMNRYYAAKKIAYEDATFLDYVHVFAPTDDGNNPKGYCQALVKELAAYNVQPSTPLSQLALLIRGVINRIPDTKSPPIAPDKRIKLAENALKWSNPLRQKILLRLIDRLKKML